MSIQVETKDCTALGDAELAELADLCAEGPLPYEIGVLSKQAEAWVLVTQVRENDKLKGFAFSTLERIGGTPSVLIGLASVKRGAKRDTVLRAIMHDELRRAVLAFPDEDVLIGTRFTTPAGFEAFKALNDVVPRPDHKASGEERAWGRRLAKRFGVDASALRRPLVHGQGQRQPPRGVRPREPEAREHPGRRRRLLQGLRRQARRLARGLRLGHGRRPRQARVATVPLDVAQAVRRRRMVRAFTADPVDPSVVDDLVDLARRAPSAGNSQGMAYLVLEGADTARLLGRLAARRRSGRRSAGRAWSTRRC